MEESNKKRLTDITNKYGRTNSDVKDTVFIISILIITVLGGMTLLYVNDTTKKSNKNIGDVIEVEEDIEYKHTDYESTDYESD